MQLTVIDVRGVTDRPSSLELNGQPADVSGFMPLVLINPEVKPVGQPATGPEGCLSFPEIYADITRPDVVDVKALNLEGKPSSSAAAACSPASSSTSSTTSMAFCSLTAWTRRPRRNSGPNWKTLMAETKAALKG